MEQWKEIVGTNGRYFVSNYGRIKSIGGKKGKTEYKIMKQSTINSGYKTIKLFVNGKHETFLVHRLVAIAFLGEHPGLDINHKNGIKTDNRLNNIEWCTRKENMEHCSRMGLRKDIHKVIALKNGKAVAKGDYSRELAEIMQKQGLFPLDTSIETLARSIRKKIDSGCFYYGYTFISI